MLAELGWGVVGPQRVAREASNRIRILEESLTSKMVAVAVLAPSAGLLTGLLVHDHQIAAGLLASATVVGAMSSAWYFIGLGRPLTVLLIDTVPRVLAAAVTAAAIFLGAALETYGVLSLVAAVAGYVLATRTARAPIWPHRQSFRNSPSVIRAQSILILGRGVSTVYTALPAAVLGVVSAGSVSAFAAVDRPMRMGLTIIAAVPNRLQSWIGVPDPAVSRERSRQSLLINAALGVLAGTFYAVAMPFIAPLLFAGEIEVGFDLSVLGGVLILIISASRGVGLALVAADRANHITAAIFSAATAGLVGLVILGGLFGAAGGLTALIAAEVVGLVVQAAILRRAWRAGRNS
ncbi:hypothetical protein GRS96_14130 [Rathayibacter sp. VKM Ac-2803]|uniref:hypothetical protein n=1 Tax=Rathayibacter sp. VKM Ac-2803 TaxID=2609256 RepID=UPI00135A8414|nr:hypothetical protein [Rathayibacter sp. VKM Ac-2803]MWV50408.1 hypothetical protein [Rathayibacter sp. VKM Ac-2803]